MGTVRLWAFLMKHYVLNANFRPSGQQEGCLSGGNVLARMIGKALPMANPDFETLYPGVRSWWVEIDDRGEVRREIGFSETLEPIVGAPLGDNVGIFTDLGKAPLKIVGDPIDVHQFENAWRKLRSRYPRLRNTLNVNRPGFSGELVS